MARKDVSKLRDDAAKAVERGKLDKAIELYIELEDAEPKSPTWPKRIGETYRRAGDNARAITAFERSVEKYVLEGFLVQAIAVCKLILQIDPRHSAASKRLAELMPTRAKRPTSKPQITLPEVPATLPPTQPPIAKFTRPTPVLRDAIPEPIGRGKAIEPSLPAIIVDHAPEELTEPTEPIELIDDPVEPLEIIEIDVPPEPEIPRIEIPPGSGLDVIDFSTLIPGTQRGVRLDGSLSGINVLPLPVDDIEELSLDDAEIRIEHLTERVPGPAARKALMTTPLFPQMPARVLETLIARMALVELNEQEVLFREGQAGDEMFVISEGEVAVETAAAGELARLGPGAFFGEIALITDHPRSATIRAVSRVELLSIDRTLLRDALGENSEILTVILKFVRDRSIDRITRTSELFRPFTDEERTALSARFELVEVVHDALLITQGERADGLYLIVAGRVEVQRTGEGVLATLGSGDVFGELSLLANTGSTANVRSVSRVLALRMPASVFQEVIMTHPQVLAYLGELAERRTPRAQAEKFLDLHLDMLV
jgi:CRP-like cAMP-binding protein